LILFFLFYPFYQFLRARKEAEILEKAFGDEYRRYKASTWL
jgi:protein-S-isoprenylcysteine O-methyltransferase Ste14